MIRWGDPLGRFGPFMPAPNASPASPIRTPAATPFFSRVAYDPLPPGQTARQVR
jgi:hypothetical protein